MTRVTIVTDPISHHPDDTMLMAYATGNLSEAFHMIVAAHVSVCDQCRATLDSFDAIGGSLLDDADASAMSDESLRAVLDKLDAAPQAKPPRTLNTGVLPRPIQDYVGGDLEAINWRPVGMGVKQAVLPTSDSAQARLLYIPAGKAMPDHTHKGRECTLVLQGSYSDAGGRYVRGDIDHADDSVTHTPVASMEADCICLVVTDAPLRFSSWLPKIVQRFVRI